MIWYVVVNMIICLVIGLLKYLAWRRSSTTILAIWWLFIAIFPSTQEPVTKWLLVALFSGIDVFVLLITIFATRDSNRSNAIHFRHAPELDRYRTS